MLIATDLQQTINIWLRFFVAYNDNNTTNTTKDFPWYFICFLFLRAHQSIVSFVSLSGKRFLIFFSPDINYKTTRYTQYESRILKKIVMIFEYLQNNNNIALFIMIIMIKLTSKISFDILASVISAFSNWWQMSQLQ